MALPLFALALTDAADASACGGCFIGQQESTVVTGHKMIFSVSPVGTTLWDQIVYAGDPTSFAWVLPTKGIVEIGLSSDALFQTLEQLTTVVISSPQISCPPPDCSVSASSGTGVGGGGGAGGGVTVIAQETVGPYETVQLQASDPMALQNWLAMHNYNIPPDVAPVIDTYVAEGFNFLALKLVPGQGIDSMRPVRVTTPGAGLSLPLRMVAAGTGAITPITLWVLGEGKVEPTNFPSFQIDQHDLVWNWDEQRSNYAELKQAGFAATNGFGWLFEAGEPQSPYDIEWPLLDLVSYAPQESGYGDANGVGANEELVADLEKLYGAIPEGSLWITRLHAELTRDALADDLDMGAAADQSVVNRFFQAEATIGTEPVCPPPPDCGDVTTGGGSTGQGGAKPWEQFFGNHGDAGNDGSCAMEGPGGTSTALGGLALVAALGLARRRRRG